MRLFVGWALPTMESPDLKRCLYSNTFIKKASPWWHRLPAGFQPVPARVIGQC